MPTDSAIELRSIALEQFASVGFAGASLQHIADAAGLSKSSVLYHYGSKEALLEAAIGPAIDRLEEILSAHPMRSASGEHGAQFVEEFIDFLLAHRLEVHTFINQGQSLQGIPVIDRANSLVRQLGASMVDELPSTEDRIRFGVALGGAAYILVAGANFSDVELDEHEARAALVNVVTQLLSGVAHPPANS